MSERKTYEPFTSTPDLKRASAAVTCSRRICARCGEYENQCSCAGENAVRGADKYAEPHGSKERVEEQLRIALDGHPESELWGEHGLIAATMRSHEALLRVCDLLESWERILQSRNGITLYEMGAGDTLRLRESIDDLKSAIYPPTNDHA